MDFLNIDIASEKKFKEIADKLFHEFAIETHDSKFRITELEFYWNSPDHIDNTTYSRKYVNPKSGDWFFHYSGVDIALKNENNSGHGGILLRSIYDIEKEERYKGPMVCAMRLFSCTNAFEDTIKTKIIPYQFPKTEINSSERVGLGINAKENNSDKRQYRFFITLYR